MPSLSWKRTLKRMHQTSQHVKVDEAWVGLQRQKLVVHLAKTMPVDPVSAKSSARSYLSQFIPARFAVFLRRPALAMLSIFGVVTGGSVASVSAAERAVPGDLLYPLKIVKEQTSLVFTKSKTDKLKLKTEFVGRRIEEVKALALSDAPQKGERIKETVEVLKRDFDTVKTQLSEVKKEAQPRDIAATAKLIDQKTKEVVKTLKDVKAVVPVEVQTKVVEAQAAAVEISVKAVQALIDVKTASDVHDDVVTNEEIVESVQDKVSGLEQNLSDATQKLVATGLASTSTTSSTAPLLIVNASSSLITASSTVTSTQVSPSVAASTSVDTINSAKLALDQTKQLISEQDLEGLKDKLGQAAQAAVQVENSLVALESAVAANASSTAAALMLTASSTLPALQASGTTSTVPGMTTGTVPLSVSSSTLPVSSVSGSSSAASTTTSTSTFKTP